MIEPEMVEQARQLVQTMIRSSNEYRSGTLTRSDIERFAGGAIAAVRHLGDVPDRLTIESLVGWAEFNFNVRQDEAARLVGDDVGHVPWVASRQMELFPERGFWRNYRNLLEPRLPETPLKRLDFVTDEILDQLEDPSRPGQWDRRGLVMGHVQSGKTNNYLGLIAKAADAGYRLIIVLAGVHNNLRAQTQHRVDEAIIGRNTREGQRAISRFGVGLNLSPKPVMTLTSAADDGDFKKAIADTVGNPFGDISHPTVFVIKKHVSILENLHAWLVDNSSRPAGHERIASVPMLLIDDEADNASIDTADHGGDDETNPTRTNLGIRRVLNLFDQSAYVGYTATPFANVFIDDVAAHPEVGDDLFPRDFIYALEAPSNYVGPQRVFGIADPTSASPAPDDDTLPMVNRFADADAWLPPTHSADFRPPESLLPSSLKRAVDSFVLACAARRYRGQLTVHNSMLIHVTRYVIPQQAVRQQVEEYVIDRRNELLYGATDSTWSELRKIWESDFVPTALALASSDAPPPVHDFEEIQPHLTAAVSAVKVKTINGGSSDVLDYEDHKSTGLSVIVVGGAKLSRGLTLEGLSISYYMRGTHMYDTLMQMGRWFGYRPGYLDLCRIYTTAEIVDWYRQIVLATQELLSDFRAMQDANGRPKDFGLRVRHSPGMLVTSAAKMRSAERRAVNFAGTRPEVTSFEIAPDRRDLAIEHLDQLVAKASLVGRESKGHGTDIGWSGVPSSAVSQYLQGLGSDGLYTRSISARPNYLADYIRLQNEKGGLTEWTVLLKSNSAAADPQEHFYLPISALNVGLARRTHTGPLGRYSVKSLIGSADERFDLTPEELQAARNESNQEGEPTGLSLRKHRHSSRGLIILYLLNGTGIMMKGDSDKRVRAHHIKDGSPFAAFCLSLPSDGAETLVQYMVNPVYERAMSDGGS